MSVRMTPSSITDARGLNMNDELLGKCGFYCGVCHTYIKGDCKGCMEEHTTGDCHTRD